MIALDGLNPGIVRTVEWLNLLGFKTCDSGDGETFEYECDRPYGYVVAEVEPAHLVSEARRMRDALDDIGVRVDEIGNPDGAPSIQATFDPANGRAFIELLDVDDERVFGK